MKRALIEIVLLSVLTVVCGTIANWARSDDDEKFLPWSTNIYDVPAPKPESKSGSAPTLSSPETPSATPPDTVVVDNEGEATSTPETSHEEEGEFEKIEFDTALESWETGEAQFIDARRTRDYVEGHITGSVSMSPHEGARLAEKMDRLLAEVPQEMPVIVYCTASANCEDSTLIAHQLRLAEYVDIRIYKGGFPEWEDKLKGKRDALITVGEEPGEAQP